MTMQRRRTPLLVLSTSLLSTCAVLGSSEPEAQSPLAEPEALRAVSSAPDGAAITSEGHRIPQAPVTPGDDASAEVLAALEAIFPPSSNASRPSAAPILHLGTLEDARVAWLLMDGLRFARSAQEAKPWITAFERVTGVALPEGPWPSRWKWGLDFLIAWDLPALPNHATIKRRLYASLEPQWVPFFDDEAAAIDWRHVTWGGVFLDERALGQREGCPRGCIPALDDPAVTGAGKGEWYPDGAVVFGVTIDGESRAYPKHQMETHELVNDTLGGRRIALPYCTLCGSAQAYFTDRVEGADSRPLVLRTSGLLVRSNKLMFDLESRSAIDTFTGEALSGPLRRAGVRLEPVSVVVSTWAEWRAAHPDTTILAEDGGIGRRYDPNPLADRDAEGPIFPVGDVDPRLPAQTRVLGVERAGRAGLAFSVRDAVATLKSGARVERGGVTLVLDGSGLRAWNSRGVELPSHEAFWFAWSQFSPGTELWRARAERGSEAEER